MKTANGALRIENKSSRIYDRCMEKRIITLEVQVEQITKSIDRFGRSIEALLATMDRRFTELDRKFMWCVRTQFAALVAIIVLLAKLANLI